MSNKTSLQQSDYNADHGLEQFEPPSSQAEFTHTIQALQQETTRLNKDVNRLQGRSNGLMGILIGVVLLFGGTLGWSILRMQTIENTVITPARERIEQLEKQITDLNRQVTDNVSAVREKGQAMATKLEDEIEQLKAQLQRRGLSAPTPAQTNPEGSTQTNSPGPSSAQPEPVTSQTETP
ncbi:hypothetical protein [Acaryochloris sp. CCMEE 5410]|uniref:hypothetical protein n=1 Tax=Acaryochloris sp. CCMEE 5410 TaxID=310037 RepID=UPI0002483CBF|nr:hypothetical protein [Acaryochloris sp. CCMEE 5410]KAI9134406.1 hypothetical protein ON05_014715 [Acaryochloris sp. CCMEE 5410]